MSRSRDVVRPVLLLAVAASLAGAITAPARADDAAENPAGSAAKRTHGLMTAAFPFRAADAPARTSAEETPLPLLVAPPDSDVVEMPEMTVVSTLAERHMTAAMERDLARMRAEQFNWRSGGRMLRADFGRVRLETGLWWQLVPSNHSGSPSASNLPLAAHVDLLRIMW